MHWHKASPAGPKYLSLEESSTDRADSIWLTAYALQLTLLSSALQAEFLRQGLPGPSHHAVLHTQDEVLKKH